jgi:hypothetical protein
VKARELIGGATFGPEALTVIGQAFDQAWMEINDRFTGPLAAEAARLVLANGILANATDDSRDAEELKHAGLRVMLLRYPWLTDVHRKTLP